MTLREFLEKGDHSGFRLAVGYYVELKHGLMGFFPAIESQSCEIVMAIDLELLKRVWKMLTPRRSELCRQFIYANPETGVAYQVFGPSDAYDRCLDSGPLRILTQKRFDELMLGELPAFKWAPGLVGNDMTPAEFAETLASAVSGRIFR